MIYYVAAGGSDAGAWNLSPPTLPCGRPIAAATFIDTCELANTRVLFEITRQGVSTDLTFYYWQAYAAKASGIEALTNHCRNPLRYSPAISSGGDELWGVCAPRLGNVIDKRSTKIEYHPEYAVNHPLSYLSGRIRSLGNIHLTHDVVNDFDMFYVLEYPVFLVVSQRLIENLRNCGITGIGYASYPTIKTS